MALTVSPEFTTATRAESRRVVARVSINFTDLVLDETVVATALTPENRVSVVAQAANGKSSSSYKFFSLDGNADLSGSFHPAPGTTELQNFTEIGFWGNELAPTGGVFATPQVVNTTFGTRSVSSVLVIGDAQRNEYPVDFKIELFSSSVLQYVQNVSGNTEVARTITLPLNYSGVDQFKVTITRWSKNNAVAKIIEVSTAIVQSYDETEIEKLSVVEQREISNENSIPIGNIASSEASLSLINVNRWFDANNEDSPIYQSVRPNAKVDIELGVWTGAAFEFIPLFSGWSRGWNVPDNSLIAQVVARDRLELLTQTRYSTGEVIAGWTFYQWFEDVLSDAGLSVDQYSIDTALQDSFYTVPFGWITDVTHRRALEILATGCAAAVYQDRSGLIQVKALLTFALDNQTAEWVVGRGDYTDKNNQPIYEAVANRIVVTTQPLEKTTGVTVYETLASEPEEIAANSTESYTIFFTDEPVSDAVASISPGVSGVSIVSSTFYSWGGEIEVQNTNGAAQTFRFSVSGSTYAVKGQQSVIVQSEDSIANNGEQTFTFPVNPFLQKKELAQEIATGLLGYFEDPERDLTVNFEPGGDPSLELGDRIGLTDRYQTKEYNIIEQSLSYSGGLSVQVKARTTDAFSFRITEAGDDRITEAGDRRRLE